MERLLPVFNKLQDALASLGGDSSLPSLPQIVVVGSQSSGKSSVLESLVGRDFLPRGAGMCTRRPLLLQLLHNTEGGAEGNEWGEFAHCPGKRFYDFAEIRQEIEAETERKLGKTLHVSSEPIRLCIRSPRVLDLSLVDLPGVTKVPIGDQPQDIEAQLVRMVMQYTKQNPNAIILAISAATSDLATSDAIQLAKRADPTGERTMGVLTKLDLMDQGTDAADVLRGLVIPLQRGFIGVVCRSQQDIVDGKSPEAARESERQFFEGHRGYAAMSSQMGVGYLGRKLNEMLLAHIRACLPDLRVKISAALMRARAELQKYGDALLEGKSNQGALMLQLITQFANNYCDAIDGTSAVVQEHARETGELQGGARINHIFHSEFAEELLRMDACTGLTEGDIAHAIKQATGPRSPLFVPEVAFEVLTRRQISLLKPQCVQAVQTTLSEMQRLLPACLPPQVHRFHALEQRMLQCGQALLAKHALPTGEMVSNLIAIELAYLNTSHPDFVGGSQAIALISQQLADQQLSDQRGGPQPPQQRSSATLGGAIPGGPDQYGANQQGAMQGQEINDPLRGAQTVQATPAPAMAPAPAASDSFINQFFSTGRRPTEPPPQAVAANGASMAQQGGPRGQPMPPQYQQPPPPQQQQGSWGIQAWGSRQPARPPPPPQHSREAIETDIIRSLLVSYFGIVKKNLQDAVPKAIMHFLVNQTKTGFQNELVAELYREGEFEQMLCEAPETVRRRKECADVVRALEKAVDVLGELRDTRIDY